MIYSVKGELIHTELGLAVVECGGVGYACRTSRQTLNSIKTGSEVKLFTYLHVSENSLDLFGFSDTMELSCFRQLISVSGIGPKAALSVLSEISPSKLALCITTGDAKTLTKCPGIGLKTAQRIVLELKDKVAKEQHVTAAEFASMPAVGGGNVGEALSALEVLGFAPAQAAAAIAGASPEASVEELIKFALKNLGN